MSILAGTTPQVSRRRRLACAAGMFLLSAVAGLAAAKPESTTNTPAPVTPREFFNAGTRELQSGKLREAEAFFEATLASQTERFQTPALYNLGHVRFAQGAEELKKGPSSSAARAGSQQAEEHGDDAIRTADDALESSDVQKMIAAYLNGKGKRRELKAARQAVLQALKAHNATMVKWQRSSGDFKSAVQLDRSQADARFNADVVDQRIAQLVDALRQLQQCATKCSGSCDKLNAKLKQLKGRIPASMMPPGAGQDDEEDDDARNGPPEGQKEAASKEGVEMALSPEQAGWLLEGFKLDSERRLPMGPSTPGDPQERARKPW